jgi:hypothetical protein
MEVIDASQTGRIPPIESLYQKENRAGNYRVEKYYFAHLVFKNEKRKFIKTEKAQNVVAHLVFYDENGKDILNHDFIGRWGHYKPQPKTVIDAGAEEENNIWIEMLPNGTYELDIAMKHKDESIFFAFNNTSYYYPEFRGMENKLDGNRIKIHVILMGGNIDDLPFDFLLVNEGNGKGLNWLD